MQEQEGRLWRWMRRHRVWSFSMLLALLVGLFVLLITLLGGMGGGLWITNLVRFGPQPPMGQNCGSIQHVSIPREQTARADADLQPLTCFWQAYHTCRATTISQTYAATDVGHTDTLTMEWRNNHCALYGQEEGAVNAERYSMTFLCTQLSKVGDMLQVSACDGIAPFALVPGPDLYNAYPCGRIGFTPTTGLPQQVEACFFAAFQHCLADYMGYQTTIDGIQVERYFYIDDHCGIAYRRMASSQSEYAASCASLRMRADGLHFSQCGTDGDLFVPSGPP